MSRRKTPWWVVAFTMLCASHAAQAASVTGTVHASSDGQPLASARVTLFASDLSMFKETRTDAQGAYSFTDVPPGVWRLGACTLGFEYVEVEAVVNEDAFEFDFQLGPETETGQWTIIGDTLPEFFDATDIAILLGDGRIMFCHDTVTPILFDPVTGEKSSPAGSGVEQGCMSATLLQNGRVIMIGGQSPSDPGSFTNAVPWVKTYDPVSDSWEWLDELQLDEGRWYPGLARLANGSLLVMGGGTAPDAERTDTCERFHLPTQTWSFTGSMVNPCEFTPSALLFTGRVLATWSPPQLYDPDAGEWTLTGDFNQPNRGWPGHSDHSLVVMADGRALAIGVRKGPDDNTNMAEVFDPATEEWGLTSNPDLVRLQTEVVQLPDGRILVAGGETEVESPPVEDVLGVVKWSDLYDPAGDTWRRVADLNWFREYHAVTLLVPDGRVVTTGGTRIKFQYGPTSADIEAYEPPYLFRGVRPEIASISTIEAPRGCDIALEIFPDTTITSVVLMGTAAPTHWVDGGVPRRLVLPVAQSGTTVEVVLPSDPNILPLGHYMLFAMVDDIPSEAVIIKVRKTPNTLPGDFDDDGDVDAQDLPIFIAVLSGVDADCDHTVIADMNDDGAADGDDVSLFTACIVNGECP